MYEDTILKKKDCPFYKICISSYILIPRICTSFLPPNSIDFFVGLIYSLFSVHGAAWIIWQARRLLCRKREYPI